MKNFELKGGPALILPAPDYIDARVLAATTNETHTVPAEARYVLFSATDDFYASYDGDDAAIPAGDVTDGTASDFNPVAVDLGDKDAGETRVTEIDLIAPRACTVHMIFYKG